MKANNATAAVAAVEPTMPKEFQPLFSRFVHLGLDETFEDTTRLNSKGTKNS